MNTPPSIPRDQWAGHPHYPAQLLLLGSHRNFRALGALLSEQARAGESAQKIGALFRWWISGMRSHEAYEERKLYPFLARRWNASFAAAEEGHEELHSAYDEVIAALDSDGDELALALEHHQKVLVAHLELEEELVIPLLLELEPGEFQAFLRS